MEIGFCEGCHKDIDLDGLHVCVEFDENIYYHANCFLDSEWYSPDDIMGLAVINAYKNKN